MIFSSPQGNKYKSVYLAHKSGATTYFIAQPHNNSNTLEPQSKIFIKQIIDDRFDDRYRKIYKNQQAVFSIISKKQIKSHFAQICQCWEDKIGKKCIFTIGTCYENLGDLSQFLQFLKSSGEKLAESDIMFIIAGIMEAVLKLHEPNEQSQSRVIHRDIKPKNIFLNKPKGKKLQIKIGDFGISHIIENQEYPTQQVGTYGYMSPACLDRMPYSFEVDAWGIGCILYQLLYLKPLFSNCKIDYKKNIINRMKLFEKETSKEYKIKSFMMEFFKEKPSLRSLYDSQFMKKYKANSSKLFYSILGQYYKVKQQKIEDIKQYGSYSSQYYQQAGLYEQRVLQAVHYPQWGYFLFTNNYKIIGCFNSEEGRKVRTYIVDQGGKKLQVEKQYTAVFDYIKQNQYREFIKRIGKDKLICQKKFECTVASLIQGNDTLLVKFQPENNSFNTHVFQVFVKPNRAEKKQGLTINTYQTSISLVTRNSQRQNGFDIDITVNELLQRNYQETNYISDIDIQSCPYPAHKSMIRYVKRILSLAWANENAQTGEQNLD